MNIGDIYFGFRGDSQKLTADAKTAGTKAGAVASKSFGSKFKTGMGSAKQGLMQGLGIGAGLGVVGVVTSAISGVVNVLGDAVSAAIEEEASIALLTKSIEENDEAWDGNMDAIEDVIEARQRLGFADDEQRDSLRELVAVTGDVNKALDLQRQAMDLARLKGMNLADASKIIGKVYAGNLGILSRYGIVLEKGATATEALAEIQRRAAGQAEAYADTTAGKMAAAQIAIDNAMEEVGGALIPIVAGFAEFAADVIPKVIDGLQNLGDAFHNLERAMSPHLALIEDTEKAIRAMAKARGADVEAAVELFRVQQLQNEKVADLKQLEYEIEYARLNAPDRVAALEAEVAALIGVGDATVSATDAIEYGALAAADATAFLDANIDKIPTSAEAAGDAMTDAAEDAGSALADLVHRTNAVAAADVEMAADARAAAEALRELAHGADIGKGAFRSFWDEIRDGQKRLRWFVRHPQQLRNELDRIERALARNERKKDDLLKDGVQRRDLLQLEWLDREEKVLRARADEYGAIGQTWGNALETGVEGAFNPNLVLPEYDPTTGHMVAPVTQKRRRRAEGGPVQSDLAYLVGEQGPELFLPNVGGHIFDNDTTQAVAAAGGGQTNNFKVDVHGSPTRPATPMEIAQQLSRHARLGELTPRRQSGWSMP